jgi:hydroxyethylthiazole kinase-like sugar kinase family protein
VNVPLWQESTDPDSGCEGNTAGQRHLWTGCGEEGMGVVVGSGAVVGAWVGSWVDASVETAVAGVPHATSEANSSIASSGLFMSLRSAALGLGTALP